MALKFSTDLKNYIVNKAIVEKLAGTCGTAGTAEINIYTGAQPATADTAASGTLLCTIIAMGWGTSSIGATGGTAILAATSGLGYSGTAATTGTAGWARLQTVGLGYSGSAATFRVDGDVGTSSTSTFVINTTVITALETVTLLTAPISMA